MKSTKNLLWLRLDRCSWADHWTNGGTGITGTRGSHTQEITESVAAFGDPQIYMKGTELHSSREVCDLSDFWEFHRRRLDSQNNQNRSDSPAPDSYHRRLVLMFSRHCRDWSIHRNGKYAQCSALARWYFGASNGRYGLGLVRESWGYRIMLGPWDVCKFTANNNDSTRG